MPHPTPTRLRVTDVGKTFGDVAVLAGVSLDIGQGRVHGLVGHNGAGKSTLIEVLAGRYPDHTGSVQVDGHPVALESPRASAAAGIAVIHQHCALVPEFSVAENLALGREPRRARALLDRRRLMADARQVAERFALDLPLDVPTGHLSVAQQQLTEIGRALASGARVLVMDEPTARLAPRDRQALAGHLAGLAANGVAILYVSHLLEEVLSTCDEVSVLRDGRLVGSSPAAALTVPVLAELVTGLPTNAAGGVLASVTDQPVLELDDFGPRGRTGSTLTVHRGETVGIAGSIGSGRSAFLEAIAGARDRRGRCTLNGRAVHDVSPVEAVALGIVLVPEDRLRRGVLPQRSVSANVTLSALRSRFSARGLVDRRASGDAARAAVDRYRIGARTVDQPAGELSGGNQQKVLLARAVEAAPAVLLCDQPTAGVDIGAKVEIEAQLRRLTAEGVAVVIVSDDLAELLALSDRIALMRHGRLGAPRPAAGYNERTLLAALNAADERGVA
ncbi:MAG: sugar ABC transporter ATP-binding protein [Phycicoccus sp.]|nr:sugar ABC transporter ATP-binding protein [Phycicoccus sp.]